MQTQILQIDEQSLKYAKDIILSGGAVAFPTETVYGLGANALDSDAVENVFRIKGRPNDNPLIVHVHKDYDINTLVSYIPEYAKKLAKEFLPGPLTMVYKSRGTVSSAVSCGLDTLAVRIPSHSGAQQFLKYVNLPIAAPSANLSKHVSPTASEHVFSDLQGRIPLILEGGRCEGGLESTVLDCTGEIPIILRSGLVTREMISNCVGECGEYVYKDGDKALSPGLKYKHYSPNCRTCLFDSSEITAALETYDKEQAKGVKVALLSDNKTAESAGDRVVLKLGNSHGEIAANLYYLLREGEKIAELIVAIAPEDHEGIMKGVMNRLSKACGSKL